MTWSASPRTGCYYAVEPEVIMGRIEARIAERVQSVHATARSSQAPCLAARTFFLNLYGSHSPSRAT